MASSDHTVIEKDSMYTFLIVQPKYFVRNLVGKSARKNVITARSNAVGKAPKYQSLSPKEVNEHQLPASVP